MKNFNIFYTEAVTDESGKLNLDVEWMIKSEHIWILF